MKIPRKGYNTTLSLFPAEKGVGWGGEPNEKSKDRENEGMREGGRKEGRRGRQKKERKKAGKLARKSNQSSKKEHIKINYAPGA